MKSLEKFYSSFVSAWNMVNDIPFPGENTGDDSAADSFLTAAMIPVAGFVPGIVLAALGMFCRGSVAGSLIWAFAALTVIEMISSGRCGMFAAKKISEKIFGENSKSFVHSAATLLMIFKLAALYIISYSCNTGFAVIFFILVFSFQMYCAVFPEKRAMILVDDNEKRYLFVFPAVMAFLWFWSYPLAVLLSLCAVYAVFMLFRKKVWSEKTVLNGDDITLAAGFLEVILLVCATVSAGV